MPVTDVTNDAEALTMTLTAEFDAPLSRVWQLYADPRQLEKWWNPPGYPLTIVDHDLSVGGFVRAFVISPRAEGQRVLADHRRGRPRSMAWEDELPRRPGRTQPDITPTSMQLALSERAGGGTVMTVVVAFVDAESMQWTSWTWTSRNR